MATTASQEYQADQSWDEHYADEQDAAWLYRRLASVDTNRERADLFGRLADVEDRHTAKWEELFRGAGRPLPSLCGRAADASCWPGSPRRSAPRPCSR